MRMTQRGGRTRLHASPWPTPVLAVVCDFVPVVGVVASGGPAILLAFTVSPAVAVGVLAYVAAFHLIENY